MGRQTNFVLKTTQEDIDNILPENRELIDDFINYLETTDHSPASIKVYKNNLYIFFTYLLNKEKNVVDETARLNVQKNIQKSHLKARKCKKSAKIGSKTDKIEEKDVEKAKNDVK